jgi:hypothetical protein
MRERLNAADYRFIAICAALLGATVWFSAGNFYRAFPEASIDFKVNRDQANCWPPNSWPTSNTRWKDTVRPRSSLTTMRRRRS